MRRFSALTNENNDDAYIDWMTVQKVVDGTSYQLDLEEQWTNVNFTDPDQNLCIKAGSLGTENLLVDAWDDDASNWVNVATLTGLVNGWKNVSVAPYITSSGSAAAATAWILIRIRGI